MLDTANVIVSRPLYYALCYIAVCVQPYPLHVDALVPYPVVSHVPKSDAASPPNWTFWQVNSAAPYFDGGLLKKKPLAQT